MSRTASSISLTILGVVAVALVFWHLNPFRAPTPVAERIVTTDTKTKATPVILPEDFEWGDLTRDQADSWKESLGDEKLPHDYFTTTVLRPGESFIADMHEARPGEFVFTKLTPTVRKNAQGGHVIDVRLECQAVTFDGSSTKVFAQFDQQQSISDGGGNTITQMTKDGTYILTMGAQVTTEGKVKLHVSNSFNAQFIPPP